MQGSVPPIGTWMSRDLPNGKWMSELARETYYGDILLNMDGASPVNKGTMITGESTVASPNPPGNIPHILYTGAVIEGSSRRPNSGTEPRSIYGDITGDWMHRSITINGHIDNRMGMSDMGGQEAASIWNITGSNNNIQINVNAYSLFQWGGSHKAADHIWAFLGIYGSNNLIILNLNARLEIGFVHGNDNNWPCLALSKANDNTIIVRNPHHLATTFWSIYGNRQMRSVGSNQPPASY